MKKYLWTILFIIILPVYLYAACTGSSPTWTSTPDRTSVNTCVGSASAGDTINISAGTETWTSEVEIDKELYIVGAGKTLTHINNSAWAAFKINLSSDVPVRITGLHINSGVSSRYAIFINAKRDGSFACTQIRIDNNKFETGFRNIYVYGWMEGLIDNNEFLNCNIAVMAQGDHHYAWTRTIEAGTANALFIEDNTFTVNSDVAGSINEQIYHYDGSRTVIRYNVFDHSADTAHDNLPIESHGNGSYYPLSGSRGQPIIEIYENTFTLHHTYRIIYLRGGSFLIYDNDATTVSGTPPFIALNEEEAWQTSFCDPLDDAWPAEDNITNSFVWDNTLNAGAVTGITVYTSAADDWIVEDHDYFMNAPESSGGYTYYDDRQGASGRGADGTLNWVSDHANAYYPYTAYTYPHSLQGADVTVPTISGAGPSGEQACTSDERNVTLYWTTSETANCRIDTSDLGDYDDATADSVTNTDSTSHSDVESFACDASYNRYVYCEDPSGNESTLTTISFSIAAEQPPAVTGFATCTGVGMSGGSAN